MPRNILVIKLGALGDFILALGAMEAIRRAHPGDRITLLTTPPFRDMAERSGYFDEVWAEKRAGIGEIGRWFALARRLNGVKFSRVYDLQMNDRTRIFRALMLNRPEWSGVFRGSPLFHDDPDYKKIHAFKRHQAVLKVAGIAAGLPDVAWMTTDVSAFAPKKPYVLLIPGSAPQHPRKRWSALRYGALALKLSREGYEVAALGGAAEAEAIAAIRRVCPAVIDLAGRTSLYDIATLARGAAFAVGNDTGPAHLVSVAGCPLTVLFCTEVSKPELSSPVGPSVQVIAAADLSEVLVEDVMKTFRPRAEAA